MSNECASSSVVADEQAISLIVDGVSLSVPKGATILDAAEKAGSHIPTLCFLKERSAISSCRICMVEVEGEDAPVPACLYHADPMTALYFRHSNGENLHERKGCYDTWASGNNPWQRTFFPDDQAVMDAQAIRDVWTWVFAPVRRTNTCIYGDVEPAMDHSFRDFELFIEDNRLGDDTPHTWFTYLPKCLREGERKQVPLVIFSMAVPIILPRLRICRSFMNWVIAKGLSRYILGEPIAAPGTTPWSRRARMMRALAAC